MTCPHCGADASAGQKFCPKCSRLVDSPLLKIKQQIDAAREEIRRDLNAARPRPLLAAAAAASSALSGQGRRAGVSAAATPPPPPSPYKYAPHPSQTPGLTRPPSEVPRETILRSQERNQKNQRRRSSATRASHARSTRTRRIASIRPPRRRRPTEQAKAAAAAGPVPERFKRPASFTVLALLDLIGAAVMFYTAMR